jgi:hypothetical protein
MTKIPEGVRTVNCNRLSKVALKASIQGRVRTVLPECPDGCTLAARNYHNKALSIRTLMASGRYSHIVRTDALEHWDLLEL